MNSNETTTTNKIAHKSTDDSVCMVYGTDSVLMCFAFFLSFECFTSNYCTHLWCGWWWCTVFFCCCLLHCLTVVSWSIFFLLLLLHNGRQFLANKKMVTQISTISGTLIFVCSLICTQRKSFHISHASYVSVLLLFIIQLVCAHFYWKEQIY